MTTSVPTRTLNHPFGRGATIGGVLARNRGVGPGFDLLRIALAIAIFVGHAKWISGGPPSVTVPGLADGVFHFPGFGRFKILLVPMFFALSGILIMGSAARIRSPATFLMHRILRILPALVVEITLSALVLGPLLTTLPLENYFRHPELLRYLGNCLGLVSFELPGLFLSNPVPAIVNINLWTLPSEFHCYLIIMVLMVTGLLFKRKILTISFAIASSVFAIDTMVDPVIYDHGIYGSSVAIYYFAIGVRVFQWRDHIPVRVDLMLLAGCIALVTIMFDRLTYVSPIFVTLSVFYMGLIPIPRIPVLSGGDYSYGIYLYGFPICQALLRILPGLQGHAVLVILGAGSITLAFSMASWHLVEKRVLDLRRLMPKALFPIARSGTSAVPN